MILGAFSNSFMSNVAHKNRSNWSPYKAKVKTSNKTPIQAAKSGPTQGEAGHRRQSQENFTFEQADDRFYDIFSRHGLGHLPHPKRQVLTRFYQLLMRNQETENMTRLVSLREVAIKHFVDSLLVPSLTTIRFPLLDMGTGPGLPGVPLRVWYDEGQILLGEGVQRRVEFLKRVRHDLDLKNLDILGRNITQECFYPVQTVITRAVEDARNTLGNVVHSLQTGGRVILMKGPNCDPEIDLALKAWGNHYRLDEDIRYEIPQSPHRRRLLIFEKTRVWPLPDFVELDLQFEREHGRDPEPVIRRSRNA
jgi:16S rRNA (guanine527-N7)-methyltransferase